MNTLAVRRSPIVILPGREFFLMIIRMFSLRSGTSSVIWMLSKATVIPGGNKTLYSPDS